MNIDEKMEQKKSDLLKVLNGLYDISGSFHSEKMEQVIQELIEIGLKPDYAKSLIDAFRKMESDKKIEQQTFDAAWNSKSGVDFTNDINKTGERATQSEKSFNRISTTYALRLVIEEIGSNEINDEILEKIYKEDIREDEINNQGLRVAFKLYTKLQESERRNAQTSTELDAERQKNYQLSQKYEDVRSNNEMLRGQIERMKSAFSKRLVEMNESYKKAIAQITTLKEHLKATQNKKIWEIIGERIKGFGKQVKQLPELEQLPNDIITNAEAMGVAIFEAGFETSLESYTKGDTELLFIPSGDELVQ